MSPAPKLPDWAGAAPAPVGRADERASLLQAYALAHAAHQVGGAKRAIAPPCGAEGHSRLRSVEMAPTPVPWPFAAFRLFYFYFVSFVP